MQVVVTTHSPDLLDTPLVTDTNLRILTWQEGASHVLRPSAPAREAIRSHLMGAGELLRSNALQAEDLPAGEREFNQNSLFEQLE
jgi:hypothetical protein